VISYESTAERFVYSVAYHPKAAETNVELSQLDKKVI
jgi:hypothetical protein